MKRSIIGLLTACLVLPATAYSKTYTFAGAYNGEINFHGTQAIGIFGLSGGFEAEDTNKDGIIELSELTSLYASASGSPRKLFVDLPTYGFNLTKSVSSLSKVTGFRYSGNGFLDQLSFIGTRDCLEGDTPVAKDWGGVGYDANSSSDTFFHIFHPEYLGSPDPSCSSSTELIHVVQGPLPVQVNVVPLPASLPLLLATFCGLGIVSRRRRA